MSEHSVMLSKAESAKVLRRAGIPEAEIEELFAQLPDPFDLDREQNILARHGVTREGLVDQMGGSP